MNKATRVIIISAMVIAIPMVAYLCYQYFRAPAQVTDMAADITETAQKIGSDYTQDETGSDAKYLGKVVDISGRIAVLQNQGSEGKTVYFKSNENSASVAVLLSKETSADKYPSTGDSVVIRAYCTGFLMDVTFNRGVIIKKY